MAGVIYVPDTKEEYERLVKFLDSLIDKAIKGARLSLCLCALTVAKRTLLCYVSG